MAELRENAMQDGGQWVVKDWKRECGGRMKNYGEQKVPLNGGFLQHSEGLVFCNKGAADLVLTGMSATIWNGAPQGSVGLLLK